MKKITKNDAAEYPLLVFFGDTVDDYIEEMNDEKFIYTYVSFENHPEFFDVLLSKKEYEILSKNKNIILDTESNEKGKAGIYEVFMSIAYNNCTNDMKPIAPLTYILTKDKYVLDIECQEEQVYELKKVLYNHIIERGYDNLKEKFSFYFSHFE